MNAGSSPDMSDIRIEPIAAAHIESFHRALDTVAREKKYLSMLEATPLPQTREFVMGMIAKGNPQFVAVAGEEVVGWCDISRHFFPSHAHRGNLGMGVLPAYRGRGLGRKLMEKTLRAAQQTGFARVELDVYEDNSRAIALYEKMGFVREGIIRRAARIDGRFIDAIGMALLFDVDGSA
ncbi:MULTISPECIES: GNAT family N-acetyltransferase [Rhizobium]|uniref:GCN5-related N-acetyltransferase protein n=1 Tax=Rhizobium phaseoli TaxID=396 RepID=A0A192TAI3_9HYPH|nr:MULTISPECIES: GNAT family N-acetyltransferase [Rhizobium]MDH6647045.1 ribosomal protein S18 acetylase RimI-like enzyme [Rhizobium esperanzae]ANL41158.1 GCN5-related N-acetyltransferase protein [Rhizobium phaseoli]ANL53893.1 GCN5-related N-acetyltransferase protein [Rhizobium phaseoli]ANL60146.1 GCN5-related N-acetyltransferase protein [Rhizobium phaseoli]ANL85539.1 GCN5-related N-acetyltransferase protein [Rhizobium phaseoli]